MAAYVFCKMPGNNNDDIFGSAYDDMTESERELYGQLYDAIISSLIPDWLAWCGDELLAETGDDRIDEDFNMEDILHEAYEILVTHDQDWLVEKYKKYLD